jgi:succinoglycan biosynthesis transport protein ExoP
MLKVADRRDDSGQGFLTSPHLRPPESAEIDRLVAAARRQLRVFIACCVLGLALGVGYIVTAVPQYTASAVLLLDNRRVRAVQDAYDVMTLGFDAAASAIDSQVEVIRSDNVALSVVDKLQLLKDPELTQPPLSLSSMLISALFSKIGFAPSSTKELVEDEAERRRALANLIRANVEVRRIPRTLVLEIQYRSTDPHKAAKIANAFADAYLVDQLDAKYDATRRASVWLQDRMAELKQQVLTSDLAVQKFKANHDLISTGGKLVNEQQLGEVNSQLVLARAETARAEARYERIKAIIEGHQTDALVAEAIGNQVIEQLRTKFVNAAKREAELSSRLGPNHGTVANLRAEMREYERLMFEELGRIAGVYQSELEVARSREKSLTESLAGLVGATASANETLVALRELEREAESYKNLYQSFLQRYQEVVQQQSFPITEARVIMSAQSPDRPSHPRKTRVLALALLFGAGIGVCLAALREYRERAFRTGEQVRDELGLEFLGMLPYIKPRKEKRAWTKANADQRHRERDTGKKPVGPLPSLMRYVLDHPLSDFAETLRSVKIAADLTLPGRNPKIVGIVSVLPEEGKSTVAMNLGELLAHLGSATLLIDADLRNPGLSRTVAPDAKEGLVEAVLEGKPIKDILLYEPDSSLAILPIVLKNRVPHTSEFLASAGMRSVLKQAQQSFAFILIDLPPLGPIVDVRAIAPQLDAVLFVTEWGNTARKLVRTTLEANPQVRDKCLGVVLSKVDMSELRLYETYGSKEFYASKYKDYYKN